MCRKRNVVFVFLGASLWLLSACGTTTPKKEETKPAEDKTKISIPEPTVGGPGEIVKKFDLNKDKRADLWKVFVKSTGKSGLDLVRIEIDLNADGKIDIQRFYKGGNKKRARYDLDFDGRYDMENFFHQGNLYKQAYYLKSKSRPDVFKYFEVEGKRKKKSVLVRKERDTNLDGRIDYWEYWEKGSLDRIGRDTDYDGKVDVWEKGTES